MGKVGQEQLESHKRLVGPARRYLTRAVGHGLKEEPSGSESSHLGGNGMV